MQFLTTTPAIAHFVPDDATDEKILRDVGWRRWGWCDAEKFLEQINKNFDLGTPDRQEWCLSELFERFPCSPQKRLFDWKASPMLLMHLGYPDIGLPGPNILDYEEWKTLDKRRRPPTLNVTAKWAERVLEVLQSGGREVYKHPFHDDPSAGFVIVYKDVNGKVNEF